MGSLIIWLLIIWLVLALVGGLVEGLLWLLVIAAILFVVTGIFGWMRRGGSRRP